MTDRPLVVLIRVNRADAMHNPPLGLLYLGDALKKAGYEVKVYPICDQDVLAHVEEIAALDPLWIGFSVNTGWSMGPAITLARALKRLKPIPIVWGNAHPSLLPEQCLAEDAIDYVAIGEGEVTAVELSDALCNGCHVSAIRGLGYKDPQGQPRVNEPREFIEDLDRYELDWSLVDPEQYVFSAEQFGMRRAFQFITSRGCPHNCGFCYNQRINRRRWRAHSEQYVVRKILELKERLDLDGIRFWDDNFFTNKKRAFSILEQIGLPYTAEVRVDYIDAEFAKRLDETQCKMVLLGLESGSNRVLKSIDKGISRERSLQALEHLSKYPGISIHPSFIIGFPTETEADFRETLKLFADMIVTRPRFWFVRLGMFLPYPGCDLYDVAVQNGHEPPQRLEEWDRLVWDTSDDTSLVCVGWLNGKRDIMRDEKYLILLHEMVQSRVPYGPFQWIVRKRIEHRYYRFGLEPLVIAAVKAISRPFRQLFRTY